MQTEAQQRDNLARPAAASELERRYLAVLFADITGFTRLVESVDPETVYEVVRPLMDKLVRLVRAHGGEIQQILGDGFMAVFGLQSVDGDEAARAVRAGLALVSAAGPGDVHPPVHVGIEYGEVLVTPSWAPAGFGVWGRAVNLAKRLCDLAGPAEVHVGPVAFARAGQGVRCATPVRAQLKGISGAVLSHRICACEEESPLLVAA
ncbi:MAG TPA: adenylate/guanylate cyclase domain-containing protein [Pilimelia sp.]|nr:adenylate/guanylate cyclase domain-containing protein [Pilimelia sp.]